MLAKPPEKRDINEDNAANDDRTIVRILAQFFPFHNPFPMKKSRTPNKSRIIPKKINMPEPRRPNTLKIGIDDKIELKKPTKNKEDNPDKTKSPAAM